MSAEEIPLNNAEEAPEAQAQPTDTPQPPPPTPPVLLTEAHLRFLMRCVSFAANHGGFTGSVDEIARMVNLSKEAEFIMVGQVNWQGQQRQGAG